MDAAEITRLLREEFRVSPTVSSYTEWEKYRGYIEDVMASRIPVEQDTVNATIDMVETSIDEVYLPKDNLAAVHRRLTEMFLDGKAYAARIMGGEHRVEVGGECGGRCIKLSSVELRISGETGLDYIVRGAPGTYRSHAAHIVVEDNASLDAVISIADADDAPSSVFIVLDMGRESRARLGYVATPGAMTRLIVLARLVGMDSRALVRGVAVARGGRMDNVVDILINAPGSKAYMLFTGLQAGGSHIAQRGVGRVTGKGVGGGVEYYTESLLLGSGERFYAQPRLEIETGIISVARHAARNMHVLPEQVFYLETRGIPRDEAEAMIIHGFIARETWPRLRSLVDEAYKAFMARGDM